MQLHLSFGDQNLSIDSMLLENLNVDVKLALAIESVGSQQRAAGAKAPQLVAGLTRQRAPRYGSLVPTRNHP